MAHEKFVHGSKEVLIKIEDRENDEEKEAIVMWRTIQDRIDQKQSGETTELFHLTNAYLQRYANEHNKRIHFLFSTSNENLKKWFQKNWEEFGFENLRYIEEEDILAADKYYLPQQE